MSADAAVQPGVPVLRAVFPSFGALAEAEDPVVPPPEETAEAVQERLLRQAVEAGRAEGRAAAHAEWTERLARAAAALEAAAEALRARQEALTAQLEREVSPLVILLAGKVLQREIRIDPSVVPAVTRCLADGFLGRGEPLTVRLAPEAAEAFDAWRRTGGETADRLRIEVDASLEPGDWLLESRTALADGRVASQLDEAWTQLGGTP